MTQANVYTSECSYDDIDPEGYRCGAAHIGAQAGGQARSPAS